MKKILSIILVSAVLFGMVLSANAYTYNGEKKTAALAGDTYVYDFKDANGNPMGNTLYGHNGNASSNAVTKDHFKFVSTTGAGTGVGATAFMHEFYIDDPDFKIGHNASTKFKAEAGHTYEIKVEWMCETANKYIFIVTNTNTDAFASSTYVVAQSSNKSVASQRVTTTFTIDGDAVWGSIPAADHYIGIATNSGTYYFYKITVTIFDKAKLEESKTALYSYTNGDVALNFNGGYTDLYMPNTCKSGLSYELATDPTGVNGNVMKVTNTMTATATMNFGIAAASGRGVFKDKGVTAPNAAEGFKVTQGTKYIVSYDIYVESIDAGKDFAGDLAIYLCDSDGCGKDGGNKTQQTITKVGGSTAGMLKTTGKWQTVSVTFTASKSAYMVIAWISLVANNSVFYLDNINVRKLDTDNFASAVKRSIRTESGEGETYVSAGLRFRGEMYGETANGAADLGFVVVPESLANAYTGTGKWFELTDGVANLASAKVVSAKDKLYGTNGTNNQYQLLITNLTKDGVDNNLKNVNFKVVMYRLSNDGTYTYFTVGTASYNEINAAYILAK